MQLDTTHIGNIGEAKALFELTRLGIQCYLPHCGSGEADLVADVYGALKRFQVKTTEGLNKDGAMSWKTTRQEGFHGNRTSYSAKSVDYFALYCIDTDTICFMPFNDVFQKSTISIRPDNYSGKKKAGMRFASDYTAEKIVLGS